VNRNAALQIPETTATAFIPSRALEKKVYTRDGILSGETSYGKVAIPVGIG
jgi:hypothetical protein